MTTKTRALIAIAIVVAVLGGGLTVRALHHPSVVADSVSKLRDPHRFASSARAGQTVADISTRLRIEGAKCAKAHQGAPSCSAILSASAFTAVAAFTLADCTAPGVYEGRVRLERYLESVRDFLDHGAKGALPAIPKVLVC